MLVVNLFGAPGAGKSTAAAYISAKLKMEGINAGLVTEFAKDKVWENNEEVFKNQAYLFGKQSFKISRCKDKVDIIITDSPLPLSILYNKDPVLGEDFNKTVMNVFNSYENINYFINRVKPYNHIGRHQTEKESNALKELLIKLLNERDIKYDEIDGDKEGCEYVSSQLIKIMKLLSSPKEEYHSFSAVTDERIVDMPTIDANLINHGYWINAYPKIEPNPMFMYGICSECEFEQSLSDSLKYCPECGAKMDLKQRF